MEIIDVDMKEIKSASKRGRTRSPETQQLVDLIGNLDRKTGKAILIEKGDSVAAVRSRLTYAAKLAGKRLKIAVQPDRVLFAIAPRKRRRSGA